MNPGISPDPCLTNNRQSENQETEMQLTADLPKINRNFVLGIMEELESV